MQSLRESRRNQALRDSVAETHLSVNDLILPYFVIEGRNKSVSIKSMPGINRLTIDKLIYDVEVARRLGIKSVLLFGIAGKKDLIGSSAYNKEGITQKAVRALKSEFRDLKVFTDVCLCGFTTHGHCGIFKKSRRSPVAGQDAIIDNDATIKILAKIAVSHAEAGANFVSPSAMMDGQVFAIRKALDENGFKTTKILGYSAKYASNFYGPFRVAMDSAPSFGDRKSYQMDFRNSDEALLEIEADIKEGAEIVMVKPALAYLDIIRRVKDKFDIPLAAFNVSGEYAMVKAFCQRAENREQRTELGKNLVLEILTSIKRAGADLVITYHAKELSRWLKSF